LYRSHPEAGASDKPAVSHLSGRPVPGLPVDKKQTNPQHKKQYRKPEVPGNTTQKTRAPSTAAETTNQSSIAAPLTPAMTNRTGSSIDVTATTIIPNMLEDHCSLRTATIDGE
jgi:hypothetical protein